VLAAVAAFFRLTRTGVAMLAAAAGSAAAQVVGIDTRRLGQYAWALGGGLAGLAAYLLAGQSYLTVTLLAAATVRAFAGMFLGGLASMVGVVVGGVLIGVLENLVSRYVSVEFGTTALFGVMLVVLLVRPAGLFGARLAVRV
jgi:branched-chain amino acid transport system permease protein